MNSIQTKQTSLPPQPERSWSIVFLLLGIATAGGYLLDHHVSITSQAMFYVLAVVIGSYTLSSLQSVACAVGAVTAFNFFFIPPRWTFEVDSREHLIALFTMLCVALVISRLATALRRETHTARLNAQRAFQLQTLASDLASAKAPHEVLTLGQQALDVAFKGPSVLAVLTADGGPDLAAELKSEVEDGMRCAMREAAILGPGTGRWPGLNAWYLPLGTPGQMNGAACIQNVLAADTEGREHAQALCILVAQTLWRLRLTESMQVAQHEFNRQQVQNTFLAAISHDLRTPLAAVVGAASALQTQRDKLSQSEQDRLLGSIVSEANLLSTITENTLQLVQLANASRLQQRDWESMEEIVGSVLARVRLHDPTRRIKSRVPEGLPLIQVDPVLLAQLLANLLDNALKYSEGAINLVVAKSETHDRMLVSVKDRGLTIPPEKHQSIFEPYSRNDHSGQRGSGLGLALCRAIADAHEGELTLRPRSGGGNSFTLTLPIATQPPKSEAP